MISDLIVVVLAILGIVTVAAVASAVIAETSKGRNVRRKKIHDLEVLVADIEQAAHDAWTVAPGDSTAGMVLGQINRYRRKQLG